MQPRISIVIPCYNAEKYIRETLDCLQKQTIEDWECVIVNDGSTDNSLEILKEYSAKDSRYRYIDKENGGPSLARNAAIAASCGKYILPLDADDLIAPSYAKKAIDYLEEHPNTKLVYCEAEFFGDKDGKWNLKDYKYCDLPWGNCIFCSAVYRRADYDKTNGYNSNMRMVEEDWDFWLSLLSEKDEVYRIPETLFYYRQHGVSRTTLEDKIIMRTHVQMIINHPQIYSIDVNRTALWLENKELFYKKELDNVINSKAYKIGKTLLFPFYLFKRKR